MNDPFDVERLSLRTLVPRASADHRLPRHQPGERFLKGPIPWSWLSAAARQPGRALQVGLVIWLLAGLRRSPTVPLSGAVLRGCGVDRHAGYRGLRALEQADLVRVERRPGRNPVVTVLDGGGCDES